MEYEKQLREEDKYTELQIQEKLEEVLLEKLSESSPSTAWTRIQKNEDYINLNNIIILNKLKEKLKVQTKRKSYIEDIDSKIKKIEEKKIKEKYKNPLEIDESQLDNFKVVKGYERMKQKLIKGGGSDEDMEDLKILFDLANICLKSKQCNEPYEILLSAVLRLINIDEKHGFDAILTDENGDVLENYEFKPCSNSSNPSGTINDDSIKKIEKCESLDQEGLKGWLVLAGIDKDNFTFNTIYKFPLEIYNEDRRKYFDDLKLKNSNKEKQTRSTYGINIENSIKFCNDFNLDYYVWDR